MKGCMISLSQENTEENPASQNGPGQASAQLHGAPVLLTSLASKMEDSSKRKI